MNRLAESEVPERPSTQGPHSDGWSRTQSDDSLSEMEHYGLRVVLEKTEKKRQSTLNLGGPEIRDILRRSTERDGAQANSHKRKGLRSLVFTRQFTKFDRRNGESPFRGFFTLFWVCIAFLLIRVAVHNWRDHGSVLGRAEILHMMSERDLVVLALTDGAMCLGTMMGLGLHKLIANDYLTWQGSGWILQNLWQALYLGAVIWWTYYRDWPWTHTIFTTLHCLVFLMKQHSYAFYNGYLSQVYRRKRILEVKLQQLGAMSPLSSPARPDSPPSFSSNVDVSRKAAYTDRANLKTERSEIESVASAIESGQALDACQIAVFTTILKQEVRRLSDELDGKCSSKSNAYPSNLSVANWADWICLPTLVYELEYPRHDKIDWLYVAEKSAGCFGTIWVMIVVSQAYIYPLAMRTIEAKAAGIPLATRIGEYPAICMDLLFPMLLELLLTWYVLWECVLNVLAELTRFADRGFYGDWWNSVSWDQWARDWNTPVHNFMLRHVYHSSISAFHLSKGAATFATFLLSALVHELVMWCLFKKVRGYLFTLQLLQVPMVSLSKTKLLRGCKVLGNIFFWVSLFLGPSVITSLYLIV